jgi:hypothetical protein
MIPFLLILFSCREGKRQADLSQVKIAPLTLLRLEDDLFALKGAFEEQTMVNRRKYGAFYEHYLMTFLNRGGSSDSLYKPSVIAYVSDRDVSEAYRYIRKIYPPAVMQEMLPQITDCVKRFKFHFPHKKIPTRVITCTTGWNYAFACMDSALIIGLDMYLGDTAKFYQMLRYPQYQTRKMNSVNILPDLARGWLLTEFDNADAGNILLKHTIFYGKLFYAIESLLPETNDSLIIGYTAKQMRYCHEYEKKLWGYFAEKNRLYENNLNTIRELTTEGPFTAAIHKDCPPRIAMWVGWQIVRSYMKQHPEVSLAELMEDRDAQKILNKSRYRP